MACGQDSEKTGSWIVTKCIPYVHIGKMRILLDFGFKVASPGGTTCNLVVLAIYGLRTGFRENWKSDCYLIYTIEALRQDVDLIKFWAQGGTTWWRNLQLSSFGHIYLSNS